MPKEKKEFYFSKWGYSRKDFQKWRRKGGLVFRYASVAERQKALSEEEDAEEDRGWISEWDFEYRDWEGEEVEE